MAGRLAGAATLIVILGAILGPAALTTHPAPTFSNPSQVAARPSASSLPAATTGPTESPEPWDALVVPPFQATAAFAPSQGNRNGVARDSAFTIRSLTPTPALELARGLHIEPQIKFTVMAGPSPDVAIVQPTAALEPSVRYRVRLDAPDGALAGSWTFTAQAPLHIVSTVPGDLATMVPTNTGIEVEFDQDGTRGVPAHFSILPPVPGRFEQHERVWAFVPDKPLEPAKIYTVTVSPGVTIEGSKERLEAGTTFKFETGVANPVLARFEFDRAMFETRPGERPVLALGQEFDNEDGGAPTPTQLSVKVHRLPSFAAAVDAATALTGRDSWAAYASTATVDTTDLALAARVDGTILHNEAGLFLQLPFQPDAGSYILTIVQPGPPAQMLLQVTNMSAYALSGEQDSVVWVNDLGSDTPLARAAVSIARGAALGVTDAAGLLRISTPAAITGATAAAGAERAHLLVIQAADGRRLVVPLGLRMAWYAGGYESGDYGYASGDGASFWRLLQTDRGAYRQTDTINVYGMVRARADRSVPGDVEVRLRPAEAPPELSIERVRVQPTSRGVFVASIHIDQLPKGSYILDLYAGSTQVSSTWIEVQEIRKPAYRIDVETDRRLYVLGQKVAISATAAFYDGTPVPGMDLRFGGFEQSATATSGPLGESTATLRAAASDLTEGWSGDAIEVAPVHPEEGQISGSANVTLLPARVWLTGDGELSDGKVVIRGTLTWADLAGMEATLDAGGDLDWEHDGPGRPIGSGKVQAAVTHLVPIKTQVGTEYDFIEKRVVPVYEYDTRKDYLGAWTLSSGSTGGFRLSIPAPVSTDDYEVVLSASDPEGRPFQRTLYVSPALNPQGLAGPFLEVQGGGCGYRPSLPAHLDAPVTLTMRDGTGATASGGRFLFLVGARGSMTTTIQDAATFSRTLHDADLPGFTVRAVWLSPQGYFSSEVDANVDPDDKRITITLTPDKARYRPGGHVTVSIITKGPDGSPVAADVVVHGLDEKLYSLGFASDTDPAPSLMQPTGSGFLQSYTTHALPAFNPGGCGSAGGGARDDFRDAVTFQRVATGADGRGSVAFDLSDDLTSWHLTATAVDGKLDSGFASVQLPVGLPFFVDAMLAPEYLAGETPVLRSRAFGTVLSATDEVRFTVSAPTLGLAATTVRGKAFDDVRVPLPALVAGDHRVRIDAEATVNGRTYRDAIIRTIHVVGSRLSGLVSSYDMLEPGFVPHGGPGLTTYVITDAGRGRLIDLLERLASEQSGRFDKLAAADLARHMLVDEFGFSPTAFPPVAFDVTSYQPGGITLLPYSSADLFLTARAALVVPGLIDPAALRGALADWGSAEDADVTRERQIAALAGRAGLGDDVLASLRGFAATDLTVRERLWLALGLAASGDDDAARDIERSLLTSAGQRLGPWVRLSTGATLRDTLDASGLLLLLAGRLGDPLAHDVSSYLAAVPSGEVIFPLEQVGYAEGFLARLPRDPGRFAWTVAGERHEVELQPGGASTLVVTSKQLASLTIERLAGELAVVTSWTSPDFALPTSSSIQIQRTVTPDNDAPDDRFVHVKIHVSFGPQAAPGCYRLADLAPSGLAPVGATGGAFDEEVATPRNWPYRIDGQEVAWCASPGDTSHDYTYAARVVSPGTYRWEPAILQFELDPRIGAST